MAKKKYFLKFNGTDYKTKVWLNKSYLGSHTGYFQPFEFDITGKLKKGFNKITIETDPCMEKAADWPDNKKAIKGVFGHHDIRPGSWHPKYGQDKDTGGVWNDVEIIETERPRIKNIRITPILNKNHSKARINIKFIYGRKKIEKNITIHNPRLWWTWDQGEPYLYKLKIDDLEIPFGIREINMDNNENFYLNGRKIFLRGSNIIPEEYLSRYTSQKIRQDIALAKEANINTLRLHAHVNRKEFYSECDRAGILIWQDFPLQWEYSNNNSFKKEAKRQIRDMVTLLYNHPSILLWCCHNEPIKSKNTLDPELKKTVKKADKTRPVITSSNFREHPYPGWFIGKLEGFTALPGKPLPSEFGAQALPNLTTMQKIFSKNDLWPPNWQKWAYHNFVYEQTFHVAEIDKGKSIDNFIKNSQNYQAKLLKFAIEQYRAHKFTQISGILQFMFVDPWPCISYSVLDYYRKPKKGFYTLKECFQPLIVIYHPERMINTIGDEIKGMFYLINDYPFRFKNVNLKIKLGKYSFPVKKIGIPPNCRMIANKFIYPLNIPRSFKPGKYDFSISLYKNRKIISKNKYSVKLGRIPNGISGFNAKLDFSGIE